MQSANNGPKVSIFTACKNAERFLEDTLDSIQLQTFRDFEIVIADGASTDRTLDILKEYSAADPRIRWVSERDSSAVEGFHKALSMARGEYIMCLPISDFYISKCWIEKCVAVLDSDISISMVHGCPISADEDGSLTRLPFNDWQEKPLPSGMDFTALYLATYCYVSELSYCVRRNVYVQCFQWGEYNRPSEGILDKIRSFEVPIADPFLEFMLNFFSSGYLAHYIPIISTAGRAHVGSLTDIEDSYLKGLAKEYCCRLTRLREVITSGKSSFRFLDGAERTVQTLQGKDLVRFNLKVLKYRITKATMFEQRQPFGIRILRKIYLMFKS